MFALSWRFKSLMLRISLLIALLGMVFLFATAPCEAGPLDLQGNHDLSLGKQRLLPPETTITGGLKLHGKTVTVA
jgi:hypothetical protein